MGKQTGPQKLEVLANRGLVIPPRRRRLREFAEDSVRSLEGLDVPSPPMPQGHLPLHLLRQGVLGPEPHALMRGICHPRAEREGYNPHLGWAHRPSAAARSHPRETRDAGGFTT